MPNLDLPQPSPAEATGKPVAQPTMAPAEHKLSDFYTGSWRRRLSSLPSAVGRPIAHWADQGRSAIASARGHNATKQDTAHQ
jgi:hypothetical protein